MQAQEFKIQGDLVSSYVWRGFYQTGLVSADFRLWDKRLFIDGMGLYRFRWNKFLGG